MKWSFFLGAVAISWFFLLTNGAPLYTVVLGTAAVALWNLWQMRSEARHRAKR